MSQKSASPVKKRKLAAEHKPEVGKAKITVQEFYEIEDQEATASDPKDDELVFKEACDQLATGFQRFSKAKNDAERTEIKTKVTLAIMMIRRLNRLGHFRNKKLKDETSAARKKVEEEHLLLQNLIHEVQHLQKEVTRCLEFKSAHERIDLAPVDEFYSTAPAEVSKPEITKNDSHQLRLARLTWELAQRKSLAEQLKSMETKKEEVTNDFATKTERLTALKPKLEQVLAASRPLQDMMKMKYEEESMEREMAQYLPKQLYYLYLQARAYKEILDKSLMVRIVGEIDVAKKLKAQLESKSGTETPDESTEEEEDKGREGGGAKLRKRRTTVTEAVEKHKSDILKLHPLSVELKTKAKKEAVIGLSFFYCPHLEIVTVKTRVELEAALPRGVASAGNLMSDSTVLQYLREGDSGLTCPNPTALKKLEHFGIDIADQVTTLGHPYFWTQKLAGLTFPRTETLGNKELEPPKDEVEGCNYLQEILRSVRGRILARLSLQGQIADLELQKVEPEVELEGLRTGKVMSKLTSWTSLAMDDYKCHPANRGEQSENVTSSDMFFSATIERNEAKLQALVHVSAAYPVEVPYFILVLKWRGTRTSTDWETLRHLEEGVNLHLPEWVPQKEWNSILTCQMYYLMSRMDILLEADTATTDFQREHLFPRPARMIQGSSVSLSEKSDGGGFLSRILTGQKGQPGSINVAHSSILSDKEHVFEIVTHDTKSGQMDNYLANYENYVKTLEKKDPDTRLVGSWTVIIGNQNQAVHLWRYDEGYGGVDKHMEFLRHDKEVQESNLEQGKLCTKRRNAILLAFSYWGEPQPRDPHHIYELRTYVLKPGTMIEWANNWVKGITYRRDYNQDVGGFFSQVGRLYQVYHLWAYSGLEQRKQIREDTWSKDGWDVCVQYTVPLIKNMQSRIMIPTKFSPLK